MRRLIWIAAMICGVVAFLRVSTIREAQRARDLSAQADWESEGGALGRPAGAPLP